MQWDLEIGCVREVNVKSGLPATTSKERLERLNDEEHVFWCKDCGWRSQAQGMNILSSHLTC